MYPEESVQAGIDARAKVIMPVHWGGFSLAFHTWKEPVERVVKEAQKKEQPYFVPKLGEVTEVGEQGENSYWWRFFD